MADTVSQFVAASDNANDYSQKQVDDIQQKALEDIDRLMMEVDTRDEELWNELEVEPEVVVADYEEVEVEERDLNWTLGLAALSAAAGTQFFLDNRTKLLINPAAYRTQVLDPFDLTRGQLQQAGRREVVRVSTETYQRLQAKFVNEFSDIKTLNNKDLYKLLNESNAIRSIDKQIADATGYVSRMTTMPPNSPQFKEAVADLTSSQSKSGLMAKNRRSVEVISMLNETGGDGNAELVWLLDPTSSHCSYCPANAGIVMTYNEWLISGLPGTDVCRGGDRCNCHLYNVN